MLHKFLDIYPCLVRWTSVVCIEERYVTKVLNVKDAEVCVNEGSN